MTHLLLKKKNLEKHVKTYRRRIIFRYAPFELTLLGLLFPCFGPWVQDI